MTVEQVRAKKIEVEKAVQELLVNLQTETGCTVSTLNVWETQTAGDNGPIKSIAVQIILKL